MGLHAYGRDQRTVRELVAARESAIGILGNGHVMDNGTGVSYLSVDTFFFFSGFLAFYSMLTSVVAFPSKNSTSWDTPSKAVLNSLKYTYAVVVHRYMRLTPMYFFILMVYMHVWPAIGNGPNWKDSTDMTFCNKWWWTNILYISTSTPANSGSCIAAIQTTIGGTRTMRSVATVMVSSVA